MSQKKNQKLSRQSSTGARTRALLLPLPKKEAFNLVLRTRIVLERLRNGETERALLNHLGQIVVITSFIVRAGYGKLNREHIDKVEDGLGKALVEIDDSGVWNVPVTLIEGLTDVVNEYDRQLGATRLEIFAKASAHLDRVIDAMVLESLPAA